MSTWTHVDGFITIDADRYTDVKELKKKIKKILGPDTDTWYLTHKELEDEDGVRKIKLPTGSEGSVKYLISVEKHKEKDWEYKKVRGKDDYKRVEITKEVTGFLTITFYGNLRDFGKKPGYWSNCDTTRYIEHWFRDLVDDLEDANCFPRAGVLQYQAGDEECSHLLQIRDGAQWGTNEVIRFKAPDNNALDRKYS